MHWGPKHPEAARFAHLYNVKSLRELEAEISALKTTKEQGYAWEVWCEGFLVTQEGVDPATLWPQGTEPSELRNRLRLPEDDKGIDGVFLNLGDSAYQAKFRTGRPTLTWDDLATFLALADSKIFHHKVVITNCENVVPILRDKIVLIRGSRLDELTPNDFKVIYDWINHRPPKPRKKKKKGYQQEAISHVLGVVEVTIAILIGLRHWSAKASALGGAAAVIMFLTTLSFLFSTPGWEPSLGGFPSLSVLGEFLLKDVVLLGAALWSLGEAWTNCRVGRQA